MTGVPDILWLEEMRKEDIPSVGGKGASLGEMASIGLPVPPAFVVTSQAFRRFLVQTGLEKPLFELLESLDVDDNDLLESAAQKAKDLVHKAKMPDDIKSEISIAYEKLSRTGEIVAARSSATAEDLPDASFAGQQETVLNIRGIENLLNGIQTCWGFFVWSSCYLLSLKTGV
jgi:Phosphoenolpyruvate synthase/pyruvate phosphate dikinase